MPNIRWLSGFLIALSCWIIYLHDEMERGCQLAEDRVLDVAMLREWFQGWITFAAQVIFRGVTKCQEVGIDERKTVVLVVIWSTQNCRKVFSLFAVVMCQWVALDELNTLFNLRRPLCCLGVDRWQFEESRTTLPSQIRGESTSYSGSAARPLQSAILDNDFRDFCSLDWLKTDCMTVFPF